MLYVVTGATGCLGMNLTNRLLQEGNKVIALGRNRQLGNILTQLGAQFIEVDLKEKEHLRKITRRAQVIFHCAALSSPWGPWDKFYQSNVVGTQNVIEATPDNSRLIHVSSPSIYFDFKEKHQIKENDPLPTIPANYYIKSKLLAESLIDKAYLEKDLKVITLRPRAIIGPFDRAIIPRLLQAERKGILPLIGSGEQIIDITYVDNVVESLILAANASHKFYGKKYNITNNEPKSLITILKLLYRALNKSLKVKQISYAFAKRIAYCLEIIHHLPFLGEPSITRYSCGVLALGQTLNIDAAKQDLHYKPIVSIEEGIHRYANWYQSSC
ncbi:3-beta hydroxysteroid dehydrogenase [Legionella norrlandica]|uniref:3-beta hydroxysteroid dehydrogenase n=1 Tax=Legionella norrlandica TaxID=1498499 RepID=A0A0A2SSL0_9GAMM|nr:NAD-dependent epimerase/dehydratase family protein [Legionella norrlandica]KGP64120.1 3-beta hydroxysteroid dehydrogenase [Legionella norrlandica]